MLQLLADLPDAYSRLQERAVVVHGVRLRLLFHGEALVRQPCRRRCRQAQQQSVLVQAEVFAEGFERWEGLHEIGGWSFGQGIGCDTTAEQGRQGLSGSMGRWDGTIWLRCHAIQPKREQREEIALLVVPRPAGALTLQVPPSRVIPGSPTKWAQHVNRQLEPYRSVYASNLHPCIIQRCTACPCRPCQCLPSPTVSFRRAQWVGCYIPMLP